MTSSGKLTARLARLIPRGIRRTFMVGSTVLLRRIEHTGWRSLLSRPAVGEAKIVYVDAGLHKKGRELKLLRKWLSHYPNLHIIGFEAHPEYFEAVRSAVGELANVKLHNVALVGPRQGATVQLNLNGGSGVGDSLVRRRGDCRSISVAAQRLSDHLRKASFDPQRDILLLRMNIEGAELFVLEDLIEAGLIPAVDGFYGYWDDPYKIGGDFAQRFDALMSRLQIETVPFNDIDCRSALRKALIKYDLSTSLISGARKKPQLRAAD